MDLVVDFILVQAAVYIPAPVVDSTLVPAEDCIPALAVDYTPDQVAVFTQALVVDCIRVPVVDCTLVQTAIHI